MGDWDINNWDNNRDDLKSKENKKEKILKNDRILYLKFLDKQYVRVSAIEQLIKLPKKNEQIRIITQQMFNAYAILLWIMSKKEIKELIMTTYSFDKNTLTGIEEIVNNNRIPEITFLIANLIKHDKPQYRARFIELSENNTNFTYIEAYNHTKIIAVKTKDDNYYVVEGSGNLSANARIEQYMFENCKESFDFHKSWITDIVKISAKKDVIIYK